MLEITKNNHATTTFFAAIKARFVFCALLSFFAALGTIPYGYRFAEQFTRSDALLIIALGSVFAAAATLSNMMLGTYSLLNMKNEKSLHINYPILLLSALAATPYGFLCFFGYQNLLPIIINLTISAIVVIVNTGIGYTAITNLIIGIKYFYKRSHTTRKSFKLEGLMRSIGFIIGLAISVMTYLAAANGVTDLLIHYKQINLVQYNVGYIAAIIAWIPCAALFANANQVVVGELYAEATHFRALLKKINISNILFLLFCLASGTAIAQMTTDFFGLDKNIPTFFKTAPVQFFVHPYLIQLALLSSAALNYFAIKRVLQNFQK